MPEIKLKHVVSCSTEDSVSSTWCIAFVRFVWRKLSCEAASYSRVLCYKNRRTRQTTSWALTRTESGKQPDPGRSRYQSFSRFVLLLFLCVQVTPNKFNKIDTYIYYINTKLHTCNFGRIIQSIEFKQTFCICFLYTKRSLHANYNYKVNFRCCVTIPGHNLRSAVSAANLTITTENQWWSSLFC